MKSSRWTGHVACYGRHESRIQGFWWGELRERETPLARPTRRWDNIKMVLQTVGWGVMDYFDLAHDRDGWRALVNAGMNLQVPHNLLSI